MKRSEKRIFGALALALTLPALGQAAIMSAEERLEKLEQLEALLGNGVDPVEPELLAHAPSPFVPDLGHMVEEVEAPQIVLTEPELLEALSAYVNPTGIFLFGGEFFLVFKEKRVKVGAEIPIMYDGKEYKVRVTDITGSNYTIGLGESEIQLKLK